MGGGVDNMVVMVCIMECDSDTCVPPNGTYSNSLCRLSNIISDLSALKERNPL